MLIVMSIREDGNMKGGKRTWGDLADRKELIANLGKRYAFAKYFESFSRTLLVGNKDRSPTAVVDSILKNTATDLGVLPVKILVYHFNQLEKQGGTFEQSYLHVTDGGKDTSDIAIFDLDNEYLQRVSIRDFVDEDRTDYEVDEREESMGEREGPEFYETIRYAKQSVLDGISAVLDFWLISATAKPQVQVFLDDCYSALAFRKGELYLPSGPFCGTLMHAIWFNQTPLVLDEFCSSEKREIASALGKMIRVRGYLPVELALKKNNVEVLTKSFTFIQSLFNLGPVFPGIYTEYKPLVYDILRTGNEALYNCCFQTKELIEWVNSFIYDEEDLPSNQEAVSLKEVEAYDELWHSQFMLFQTPSFDADLLEVVAFECPLSFWKLILTDIRTDLAGVEIYLVLTHLILSHKWEHIRAAAAIENKSFNMLQPGDGTEIDERRMDMNLSALFKILIGGEQGQLGKWEKKYIDSIDEMKPKETTLEQYRDWLIKQTTEIFAEEQFD